MILFVVDIFYLQFIRRFETNLTISLKKSKYSTFMFLKKIPFGRILPGAVKSTYNNLFLFFGTTGLSLCSKDVFKLLFVLSDRDSARVKLFKFQTGS